MGLSNFSKDGANNTDKHIEIYAELNHKQFKLIQRGKVAVEVPYGVKLRNRAGSRALFFSCPDKETAQTLEKGLDESSILWQRQ